MGNDNILSFSNEDNDSLNRLKDNIRDAKGGKYVVSKEFFTPNIWMKIQRLNLLPKGSGFLNLLESDRRLFVSDLDIMPKEIILLKITDKYPQKPLRHKDYLGALMSLGIDRNKFSDLVIDGEACFVFTFKILGAHIKDNLEKAGRHAIDVDIIEDINSFNLKTIERKYEEILILIPSRRLDVIVSEITKKSRSETEKMIKSREVMVNYEEITEKSLEIKQEDIITVKGYGKFIFYESLGFTKKQKEKCVLKKYL